MTRLSVRELSLFAMSAKSSRLSQYFQHIFIDHSDSEAQRNGRTKPLLTGTVNFSYMPNKPSVLQICSIVSNPDCYKGILLMC